VLNDNAPPDQIPPRNGTAINGAAVTTPALDGARVSAPAAPAPTTALALRAGAPELDGPGRPRPTRPQPPARATYRLGRLLRPNAAYRTLATWLERSPRALRLFTATERRGKEAMFGCRMCGQCALPATGYACPMTCPKQLRNGPCGGVSMDGGCEVYPEQRCVWVIAYERAEGAGHAADLARLQRPVDHRQTGRSSWVNYWLGRDEDLWTADDGLGTPASVHRAPVDLGLPTVGRP
jgi:Methylene-tetrahydrofolate reductase C terminal